VIAVSEQTTIASTPTNQQAASTDGRILLVAGGLLKGQNDQLFIQQAETAPHDPGFNAKQTFRVAYDVESARWHLFRGTERKTLAPRAIEAINDLFVDSSGKACDAFYTGPLRFKKT
jgi:hypothetical protein